MLQEGSINTMAIFTAVYVFKKALFLLHALVLRFGSEGKRVIPLPDTSDLPIFSDNVIPTMLVHFGILDLSATTVPGVRNAFPNPTVTQNLAYVPPATNQVERETSSKADSIPGPELSEEEAYVLRAAAIDACEMIVRRARGLNMGDSGGDAAGPPPVIVVEEWVRELTLPELDGWLWSVAKAGAFRDRLSRFRQVGTPCVMY
jgi:hypothetical protein